MFIDITEPKKPLEAEKIYNKCYRQGEEITPEICMEVLRSTNYATCMKRMLTCVERLPAEKQANFKEVVLATFTNREQPEEVAEVGERLAIAGGYAEELGSVMTNTDVNSPLWLSSADRAEARTCVSGMYYGDDFRSIEYARFMKNREGRGEVRNALNLPKVMDFRDCDVVWVLYDENFAGDKRTAYNEELTGVERMLFKEGAFVNISESKLPKGLDVSRCGDVYLTACDLGKLDNLTFREGAGVDLTECVNIPRDVDFSMCNRVCLSGCDLSLIDNLTFKDGADIDFASYVPAYNFPPELDFSCYGQIRIDGCDLSAVKVLTFRDKEQYEKSLIKLPEGWKGELVIGAEDKEPARQSAQKQEPAEARGELKKGLAAQQQKPVPTVITEVLPEPEVSGFGALWKRIKGLGR